MQISGAFHEQHRSGQYQYFSVVVQIFLFVRAPDRYLLPPTHRPPSLPLCLTLPPLSARCTCAAAAARASDDGSWLFRPFSLSKWLQTESTVRRGYRLSPLLPRAPRVCPSTEKREQTFGDISFLFFTHRFPDLDKQSRISLLYPLSPTTRAIFTKTSRGTMQVYLAVIFAYGVSGKLSNFSLNSHLNPNN